jgi:flotillin
MRDARIAEAAAEQEKIVAETASQTRQAQAHRDLEVKRAEYLSTIQVQKAAADKAYEIETNVQQQRVVTEQVKVEQVRKQGETAVQEAEIKRREKELMASLVKPAEAERQRIETLAEAEKQKQILQANARAETTRLEGQAQAEIIQATGQAEAQIIQAKGQAEANAMEVKAQAYQEYNQAAVIDKLFTEMPAVVSAMSEPLTKVDKITVISTGGNGDSQSAGVNKVTADMAAMIAQIPAIFEALTGVSLGDLMKQVPQIQQAMGSENGRVPVASETPDAPAPEPAASEPEG